MAVLGSTCAGVLRSASLTAAGRGEHGDHIEHNRVLDGWRRHVVGVGLGILVVAVLIGHARLAHELATIGAREFVLWPQRVAVGLVFLLGVVLVLVIRIAPRLPAPPTIVALVLLYGAAGSLPILPWPLPLLGPGNHA